MLIYYVSHCRKITLKFRFKNKAQDIAKVDIMGHITIKHLTLTSLDNSEGYVELGI